jgi:hypothetical protein
MTKIVLLVGAVALTLSGAALAKPDKAHGGHGKGHAAQGHGKVDKGLWALGPRGNCPPGLAKKGNGCLPPGQAKKLYNVGQRYDRNLGNVWSYNQIPSELRNRYGFEPDGRYYYNQGYIYQVDPTTMLVQQVISALLS